MKLFKGNYGWSTSAHSKTKEGKDIKCYLDTQFAKQSEPNGEDIEGDLIFRSKNGQEWTCFFSSYEKKGIIVPKLVLMPKQERVEQMPMIDNENKDLFHRTQDVVLDTDDLPFY